MRYILVPGSLKQFNGLRKDYEREKNIKLDETPSSFSFFSRPTFFGGVDVKNREKQVSFLEKMYYFLKHYLLKDEDIKDQLRASQVMIATSLYIQSQISGTRSKLYQLINTYLGITSTNYMDDDDKERCYHTAYELISNLEIDAFNSINTVLREKQKTEFTQEEWDQFYSFLTEIEKKRKLPKLSYNKYPITSVTRPAFGEVFSWGGMSIGWCLGNALSGSSMVLAPQLQLTYLVGSALLMAQTTEIGVMLLAPTIGIALVSSFCSITGARITGIGAKYIGNGLGIFVGYPLDCTYVLLREAGSLIIKSLPSFSPDNNTNGLRICNGEIIANSQPTLSYNNPSQYPITEKGEAPEQKSSSLQAIMRHYPSSSQRIFSEKPCKESHIDLNDIGIIQDYYSRIN